MSCILSLEASSDYASVAVLNDGKLLEEKSFHSKRSLSADLFPVLSDLLERIPKLSRITVGLGPGSYAGVRITIAAALGLQSVLGCELVGVPSVASLGSCDETFQAIGDARRGTWYYTQVKAGVCTTGPCLLQTEEELLSSISKGEGPVRSAEVLPAHLGCETVTPQASVLGALSEREGAVWQRDVLEPLYLRPVHITLPTPK